MNIFGCECVYQTHLFCLFQVIDRENQMDNPCSGWLSDVAWDNITELEKLTNFHGIITSFEQYPRDWNIWYTSNEPENTALPGMIVFTTAWKDFSAWIMILFNIENYMLLWKQV